METKVAPAREPALAKPKTPDFTEQFIEPFAQFRSDVDRLFENLPLRRLPSLWSGLFSPGPALEMSETKKAYKITAELPGIDPDDVDVTFEDGLLRIAGEKKEQREESERGYRFSERRFGAFERAIELPSAADDKSIDARFKDGLLTVTVAKNGEEKRNLRRIKVERA